MAAKKKTDTRYSKPPREGTRVRFQPSPASLGLYSDPPRTGEEGTVRPVAVGGGKKRAFMPGPGGGLLYVEWDASGWQGVSLDDVVAAKGGARRDPAAPTPHPWGSTQSLMEQHRLKKMGALMQHWHSSQGDPIYAVGSYYFTGKRHPSVETEHRALSSIEMLLAHPRSSEDREELEQIRDFLQEMLRARHGNPLVSGCSQRDISENIHRELHRHPAMPVAQGAAIAYSHARRSGCDLPPARRDNPTEHTVTVLLPDYSQVTMTTAEYAARLASDDDFYRWTIDHGSFSDEILLAERSRREADRRARTAGRGLPRTHMTEQHPKRTEADEEDRLDRLVSQRRERGEPITYRNALAQSRTYETLEQYRRRVEGGGRRGNPYDAQGRWVPGPTLTAEEKAAAKTRDMDEYTSHMDARAAELGAQDPSYYEFARVAHERAAAHKDSTGDHAGAAAHRHKAEAYAAKTPSGPLYKGRGAKPFHTPAPKGWRARKGNPAAMLITEKDIADVCNEHNWSWSFSKQNLGGKDVPVHGAIWADSSHSKALARLTFDRKSGRWTVDGPAARMFYLHRMGNPVSQDAALLALGTVAHNRPFTVSDLSDAIQDDAAGHVRAWEASGLVERIGRQGRENTYFPTPKGWDLIETLSYASPRAPRAGVHSGYSRHPNPSTKRKPAKKASKRKPAKRDTSVHPALRPLAKKALGKACYEASCFPKPKVTEHALPSRRPLMLPSGRS